MSSNYAIDRDLKEALAMAEGLEEYVRGDALYGHSRGGIFSNMPSLTIGALVMRVRRLEVLQDKLDPKQAEQLANAMRLHGSVQAEWTHHYSEKIKREVHSRLDAMAGFFRECSENPAACAGIYKPEISRRTIVQELLHVMADKRIIDETLPDKVNGVDGKLRGFVRPAGFQWSDELESIYPKNEYWWLYAAPPRNG